MRRITNEILGLNGLKRIQIFLRPIVMFLVTSQNFYGFLAPGIFFLQKVIFFELSSIQKTDKPTKFSATGAS